MGSLIHRFVCSLIHSLSCTWILSNNFIGISTTIAYSLTRLTASTLSLLPHLKNFPIGNLLPIVFFFDTSAPARAGHYLVDVSYASRPIGPIGPWAPLAMLGVFQKTDEKTFGDFQFYFRLSVPLLLLCGTLTFPWDLHKMFERFESRFFVLSKDVSFSQRQNDVHQEKSSGIWQLKPEERPIAGKLTRDHRLQSSVVISAKTWWMGIPLGIPQFSLVKNPTFDGITHIVFS